ncbi:cyprosin [Lactuca sativa]|uniref:cyprosin n=1 Tax=Lactuca sativa TaxID=4236 RepID=UPI000CD8D6C9|nr:cyprosin [Lactuca sativa]
MDGVAEGLWELVDLHENNGEIMKSVKRIETIYQNTVSFLPVIEFKTRKSVAIKHGTGAISDFYSQDTIKLGDFTIKEQQLKILESLLLQQSLMRKMPPKNSNKKNNNPPPSPPPPQYDPTVFQAAIIAVVAAAVSQFEMYDVFISNKTTGFCANGCATIADFGTFFGWSNGIEAITVGPSAHSGTNRIMKTKKEYNQLMVDVKDVPQDEKDKFVCNIKALRMIRFSLQSDTFRLVSSCTTAKEVWDRLKELYSTDEDLEHSIQSLLV